MEEDIKHICSDMVINHYKNVIISSLKDFDIDILLDKDVEENQHTIHMNFGETKMDATLVSCGFNAIIEAITRNICEAYAKKMIANGKDYHKIVVDGGSDDNIIIINQNFFSSHEDFIEDIQNLYSDDIYRYVGVHDKIPVYLYVGDDYEDDERCVIVKKNSVSVVSPYLWRIANINDYGYDVEYSFTLKTI